MAETILEAELVAACSSLGYSDGGKYVRDPECLEIIRDLLRYLRRDDSTHQIRLALGESRVLQTDLLPLLREHYSDNTLLDLVLRLLVNLTTPALLVFHQEVPEDKSGREMYLRLVSQQQGFKEAFTDAGVWASIAEVLGSRLQQGAERDDDANLIVEMCLVLLRNVLAVAPGQQDTTRTSDDADLHDQVLWSLHLAGIPDLLLYLSTATDESDLSLHTLEIISLMLRQQDPQNLAGSALHRSTEEQRRDSEALVQMRQAEKARRQQKVRKHYNARHSRFGGTYCVQNMKSISDRDIIAHKPVADLNSFNFDHNKKGKKIPKNRAPLPDSSVTRRSTLAIRLFLQEFCVEFLNGAYNNIMSVVKDNLNRARVQEHDESYYLWAMKFFMEFNRYHEFKVELVTETLSIQSVHYVQTNIETYHEMMTTEKKKIPLWSRRMHNGLRAYQEILMTLAAMDKSTDSSVRDSSLALKSKMFYVVEYRELPLVLLLNYDYVKMSKGYLKDLIETTHIFLKLLEGMCKKTKHLMVQLPQRAKSGASKKKSSKKTISPPSPEKLEEMWSTLAEELSSVLQGEAGELPVMVPFDALSELTEDEQKEKAMRKVNALLRERQLAEAVALFRASREVWPEGDIFGAQDIDLAGEFACLREVFIAELNSQPGNAHELEEEEEEEEEEEDEEDTQAADAVQDSAHLSERELDFPAFVRRFAHVKVLQAYTWLFKSYTTNSAHTNRCIIKLFHRIAWDSKLPAVLFQSSLFVVLHEAMTDPARKSNEIVAEIAKFGKYLIRQFFTVAETNPKVFMEILFWKNYKEAVDIECGYDKPGTSKAVQSLWSEEEEDELTRLFEEFSNKESDPDDPKDVADHIMQNLIRQDRSRRMIIKKLKDLSLISSLKEIKKKPTRVKANQWTDVELEELKLLFAEHKDAMDPMGRILDFMVKPKPKHRVVEKLLEIGLIQDKKEVRKKKVPKPKKGKNMGEQFLDANRDSDGGMESEINDDSDESDSENEENVTSSRQIKQITSTVVTPHLVSAALKTVLELGFRDSVSWLVELLTEVADDRESDGDFSPIPILAVSDEQSRAIDNEQFQALMKVIGIQPPQTHEEMFWRVPEKLSVDGLRKRVQYLTQGLAGTLPSAIPNESTDDTETSVRESNSVETNAASPEPNESDADDNDKENQPQVLSDDFSQDDASLSSTIHHQKSTATDRSNSTSLAFDSLLSSSKSTSKQNKKRRILMELSDDEDLLDNEDIKGDNSKPNSSVQGEPIARSVNSNEDDIRAKKRTRILDSDDESSNDSVPVKNRRVEPSTPSQRKLLEETVDSDEAELEPMVRSRARTIADSDDEL